ncbi:c-type cytochrome [Phenylobacterium sp.]|uniref:c-type cytochrome n=1 Tax=Phenylobacterium sp. TaxID=1871053 RepID=UPI0039832AF8
MSDLTFNKVAGAVLATGLAIVGLRELSAGVFAPPEIEKPGYLVEVAEAADAGGAAVEAPIDWGTVLPTADVAAGEAVFAKCKSCHVVDQGGANGTGPGLFGVVGAKPGAHPGFGYSSGMADFAGKTPVWTYEQLNIFIKAPQKTIGGTKMTFVGLKKPEDRINVIAYLRSKGGSLPVPAPDPAVAAQSSEGGVPAPSGPDAGQAAPGAAEAGKPTATGSTAAPAVGAGGPTGQGPGASAEVKSKTANPN